ncbi:hypothetical protein [Rhizobium sp. Leaf386]|uniref:Pam3-gp28 family putative phage holin n=1 Tax=Rhizobium sp. Leaf386 TaxID=1736359 RepID=UPI00071455D8|nr:hypothetical protein [Rhizobium sp. Leaf386]KQS90283.1 hypothetical protein ASG50_07440 [Rhizobium sp. Leaf386]
MDIKTYYPVIARYVLGWLFVWLATRGYLSEEQGALLTQNMDTIIGSVGALAVLAYALIKRPSSKGLAAAKAIDKEVPKNADVVIVTPGQGANITIPAEKP